MKTIRTAIIGTGFMGRVHLEAVRRVESVEAAAIFGRNDDATARLAAAFSVPKATGDYQELFRDPAIDAVHICTPNAQHFPMAKEALQAGKHVLCEKPLTTTVAEAEELVALAAAASCAMRLPQSALLPHGAADARACAKPANSAKSWSCRAPTPRTGCSTTRTGTGASRRKGGRRIARHGRHRLALL